MSDERSLTNYDVAIVSCDIIGHSSADLQQQIARIAAINTIVAQVIDACGDEHVVWASGGDGGHTLFRQAEWCEYAIDLIARLRQWSAEAEVPLRVTAHMGPVTDIRGADGRVQMVGDGINLAGWILTRGASEGVIVSKAFRDAVEQVPVAQRIAFHDARTLRDKNLIRQRLMLMSIEPDHSSWPMSSDNSRAGLSDALDRGAGWDVLYFAKRILQTNTVDAQASRAIKRLRPSQLAYHSSAIGGTTREPNPFFEYLEPSAIYEIAQLGQLVERRYNDAICRYGDDGDTMFVILHGEVGVYKPDGQRSGESADPAFTLREGDIVGELAFALGRSRTADLTALSDVALLSFSYEDFSARLPEGRAADAARERVSKFIAGRALEHICHGAPYLLGHERSGPLAVGEESWQDTLTRLEDDTLLIPVDRHKLTVAFNDVKPPRPYSGHGLYILTTGGLRGGIDDGKKIRADSFPLLWIDIPGILVLPKFTFDVEAEPVKILYIDAEGLARLEPLKREALYSALRRAAARCYQYDAFISYNSLDESTAMRWKDALSRKGLQVYLDTPDSGIEFPSRLRSALLDSRAIIALISANVMVRDPTHNWVKLETDFHREYFKNPHIFPVRLPGGQHEKLIPGFAAIDATADEDAAIQRVAHHLFRLREGDEDPPYSEQDMSDLKLL